MRLFLNNEFLKYYFNRRGEPNCWITISAKICNMRATPKNDFELHLSKIKSRCIDNKLRVLLKTLWVPTKCLKFKVRTDESPLLLAESIESIDRPSYKEVGEFKKIELLSYTFV